MRYFGTRYVVGVVAIAMIILLAPVPKGGYQRILIEASGPAETVVFGNSVIAQISRCDDDPRTIPQVMQDRLGRPVVDLSYGGQTLEESVNFAALAVRNPHVEDIVVTFSLFSFVNWDNLGLQDYMFFRLANPDLAAAPLLQRLLLIRGLKVEPWRKGQTFEYNGEVYPEPDNRASFLAVEKNMRSCPENDGFNTAFIEALYYNNYLDFTLHMENLDLLESLVLYGRQHGKRVHLVLMPIDYDLLGRFQPSWPAAVRERAQRVLDALQQRSLPVLDLSETLPNQAFADRWCACGHLLAAGRAAVSADIVRQIDGAPAPVPAPVPVASADRG